MKKFFGEFREFALRGNVLNLAIGVIIGASFQSVVASLTENILSPIIGLFNGENFDSLHVEMLGVTLRYGAFITSVINFFIMAFVVFILIRAMKRLMSIGIKEAAPSTRMCPYCTLEISVDASRCPYCTSLIES